MDDLNPGAMLATGLPGGLALVAASYAQVDWVRDCLMVVGGLLACFAVVILVFWMRDQWIWQQERIANLRDRIYSLAHEARYLTVEQMKFVTDTRGRLGTDRSLSGETYLHGTDDVPLWWVAEFLSHCGNYRLYAIRNYYEGTDERRWAVQTTAVLVNGGYADGALGNHSATWAQGINPQVIADELGLKLLSTPPLSEDMPPEGVE